MGERIGRDMSFLFEDSYYEVNPRTGISPFQNMCAYLGGSAIQTVGDNPVTAYRQLVQQYAKDLKGNAVDPKVAVSEANAVFMRSPLSASMSGLFPRLVGVGLKRIPKFGFLLGYSFFFGEDDPGFAAATAASILSAPFINPVRMVEKQQRAYFKQTGAEKPLKEIFSESGKKIPVTDAVKEMLSDMSKFGLRGVFRGQGIGIAKAIVSLTLFHEGRLFIGGQFKASNKA